MTWYTVLNFHGSEVFVEVIAEDGAMLIATSMTGTTFSADSKQVKNARKKAIN